jgi:Kef-type K+ transport system membrane component KefB/nucleotide-binding universal stress UspA family protein
MNSALHSLQGEPIVSFLILLAVILFVPSLFERIRLPGLVGLLVAGVALGPDGLQVLHNDSETMKLLSDIGLVYLMFVAGLEVDLDQFIKTKNRSIGFGSFTFLVPQITGTIVGRLFGFDWNASILIGSLFASHTLLAYPIISRLGVVGNEAVTVTIGATIFTDIGALLVLAICIGIHAGNFTLFKLFTLLMSLAIYTVVVLFGFERAGRAFFARSNGEEGSQFLFVLLAVFLAAVGAQLIGVEKIVGAFLSGLAVNRVVGEGAVKEKVMFVGSVLFIPIFFVNMGLLIRIPAFVQSLTSPQLVGLTAAIVVGLISSKFGAAFLAKLAYRYKWQETLTMWSLSLPQVAATLAATLVGYRAGLLTEAVLNSVIVLMLVTSTLGPILTARFADGLTTADTVALDPETSPDWGSNVEEPFVVVVPIYNPQTETHLLEMAALLARHKNGQIMPLAIAHAHVKMDAPQLDRSIERGELLLANAAQVSQELSVSANPLLRIDNNVAQGISRASREQKASLVVMGWGRRSRLPIRLFGNIIDSVLWASHCPVAVSRLLDSPMNLRRVLVPIENLTQQSIAVLKFAQILAAENQGQLTLLHICDRTTSRSKIAWIESQLSLLVDKITPSCDPQIQILPDDEVVRAIVHASKSHDLVILRSSRRHTSAGGLAISDITAQATQQISCSVVMLGEPHRSSISVLVT